MTSHILYIPLTILLCTCAIAKNHSFQHTCLSEVCAQKQHQAYLKKLDSLHTYDLKNRLLNKMLWKKRVVAIYSNTPYNTKYTKQLDLLAQHQQSLRSRDVVIMLKVGLHKPRIFSNLYPASNFIVALIGKDGGIKKSFTLPVNPKVINGLIDKMPMRQREMMDKSVE